MVIMQRSEDLTRANASVLSKISTPSPYTESIVSTLSVCLRKGIDVKGEYGSLQKVPWTSYEVRGRTCRKGIDVKGDFHTCATCRTLCHPLLLFSNTSQLRCRGETIKQMFDWGDGVGTPTPNAVDWFELSHWRNVIANHSCLHHWAETPLMVI